MSDLRARPIGYRHRVDPETDAEVFVARTPEKREIVMYSKLRSALFLAALAVLAACAQSPLAPTDPGEGPGQEPVVDLIGARFVLEVAAGAPIPFLLFDFVTEQDGTHNRIFVMADTLWFAANGAVTRSRRVLFQDETPGFPIHETYSTTTRSGVFTLDRSQLAIVWGFSAVPVPGGTDALVVRDGKLVLAMNMPAQCAQCPEGPAVELIYVRR